MKVLNLKDMSPDLMKAIKIEAVKEGVTIKQLVIAALEAYLGNGGKE